MSRFLSSRLSRLGTYVPGEQPQDRQYIKLNTNESPYPPAPLTEEKVREALWQLHLYPDPDCRALTKALAEYNAVLPEQILCANGSDDILSYIFLAFGDAKRGFSFPDITYGFYQVYGDFYSVPYRKIPLREDFSLAPEDYFALDSGIILANPNAQTGLALELKQIAAIAEKNPDQLVVVDEAYVDFGGESAAALLPEYDNILVVRTFSKSRSLAGGRLGYAIAGKELIVDLNTVKYSINPYNVNRMTQAAGIAALQADGYYVDCCKRIMSTRESTKKALQALGMEVTDSKANFLLAHHASIEGEALYRSLKERGILVRHFKDQRIRDWIRISIGTEKQMARLVAEIGAILE